MSPPRPALPCNDRAVLAIEWFWRWSPAAWNAIAAWLTLGVAAAAAWFAWHQVREARRTREDQAQPFVVVDFEPTGAGRIFMDLVIRNTGTTVATDVEFAFDPPISTTLGQKVPKYRLEDSAILSRGIPTLPPGKEHRLLFDQMPDRSTSTLPRSYKCVVSFKDSRQRPHSLTYRLDLDIYFGVMNITIYGEHDSAAALRDISKNIKRWTTSRGLQVWARDDDALAARNEAQWLAKESDAED